MKKKILFMVLPFFFTGCLNTDGDLDGGTSLSSSVAADSIQPGVLPTGVSIPADQVTDGTLPLGVLIGDFAQLPAPLDGSCGLNQIMQWNGADWICIDTPSVSGAPTTSVPASGITAGTISSGVILPAAQIGAGALPASVTLSSPAQLPSPLNGTGCSVDQILEWNGSAFVCVDQIAESVLTDADPATNLTSAVEGDVAYDSTDDELQVFDGSSWVPVAADGGAASSVPASGVTAGTFPAGVLLPASQLTGTVDPATQIGAGALPASVTLSSVSQLPAPLNGTGCSVDQILEWNGSAFVCVDKSASGLEIVAVNPATGNAAGDVVYNSTDNIAYVYNGTDWEPLASSGASDSIITDVNPAANLTSAVEGDVAYDSTDDELQVFDGTSWVPVAADGGAASSVPASGVTAGTFPAGVLLPASQLIGTVDPATQIGAGALPASVTLSSASQLPAPLNGTGCSVDQILEWNGSAFVCVDQIAESVLTDADPATNLSSAALGDIAFNTTSNELEVFDGTSWVAVDAGGGAASSVPASGVTAGTFPVGVLLPTSQLTGTVDPATQIGAGALPASVTLSNISQLPTPLNGTGCTNGQILEWNGSAFACVNQGAGGSADNLGDHTATQVLNLNGNFLSGDGDAEGVFVTTSGNVGVGTASPTLNLDVAGNIGAQNVIVIGQTSSPQPQLNFNELGASTWNVNSFGGALNFDSPGIGAGNRKVTITSSGNVGIGTTNPLATLDLRAADTTTDDALRITTNANNADVYLTATGSIASESNLLINIDADDGDADTRSVIFGKNAKGTGAAELARITETGMFGVGRVPVHPIHVASGAHVTVAGVWTDASDRRIKQEISQNFSKAIDQMMKLKPVRYYVCKNRRASLEGGCSGEFADDKKIHMGFYAQDLLNVFPEAVSGDEAEGYGVSYGSLVVPVIAALKDTVLENDDQNIKLEALKNENIKLKERLDRLEKMFNQVSAAN